MQRIQRVGAGTARQLSSTQAVATVASVVKELLENSVDAGATAVDVVFVNSGLSAVIVGDDGCGIPLSDVQGTLIVHRATSKLDAVATGAAAAEPCPTQTTGVTVVGGSDGTFGFRGEALHAIATVADVTVITRTLPPSGEPPGPVLTAVYRCGCTASPVPTEASPVLLSNARSGTKLVVSSLFAAMPVRRNAMLSASRKVLRDAVAVVRQCAVARPGVRFFVGAVTDPSLTDAAPPDLLALPAPTKVFTSRGAGTPRSVVADVFGGRLASTLVDLRLPLPGLAVEGYISKVNEGRTQGDLQYFVLDGRPVELPKWSRVANECYSSAHPSAGTRYPVLFFFITTEPTARAPSASPATPTEVGGAPRKGDFAAFAHTASNALEAPTPRRASAGSYDVNVVPSKREVLFADEAALLRSLRDGLAAELQRHLSSAAVAPAVSAAARQRAQAQTLAPVSAQTFARPTPGAVQSSLASVAEAQGGWGGVTSLAASPRLRTDDATPTQGSAHVHDGDDCPCGSSHDPPPPSATLDFPDPTTEVIDSDGDDDAAAEETAPAPAVLDVFSSPQRSRELAPTTTVAFPDLASLGPAPPLLPPESAMPRTAPRWAYPGCLEPEKKGKAKRSREFSAMTQREACEAELDDALPKADFQRMRVAGQFNDGFLLGLLGEDAYIIDQHASDEKFNYERLCDAYTPRPQPLIQPVRVAADPAEVAAAKQHHEELAAHGFRVLVDDPRCDADDSGLYVAAVPVLRYETVTAEDVLHLTQQLLDYGEVVQPLRAVWHSMATKACRSSIMIGTTLGPEVQRRVVRNLSGMDHPWNCPHGRPTLRHATKLRPAEMADGVAPVMPLPDITRHLLDH